MEFKASLEAVRTKKNVTDDIVQTVIFNLYGSAEEIGALNTFYKKPLVIKVEVSK